MEFVEESQRNIMKKKKRRKIYKYKVVQKL